MKATRATRTTGDAVDCTLLEYLDLLPALKREVLGLFTYYPVVTIEAIYTPTAPSSEIFDF